MNQLFAFICVTPFFLFGLPSVSFILRFEIVYWPLLAVSLIFPWISYELVQNNLGNYDEYWFVSTVTLPVLMLLYKLFDNYMLRIKKRHLFTLWSARNLPINEGWTDILMQVILIVSPLFWLLIGAVVF